VGSFSWLSELDQDVRIAGRVLPGVHPTDPTAFGGSVAFLAAVAFAASFIPARRAMRIDPVLTLRQE
jgi:putative ABC transport system permease protein